MKISDTGLHFIASFYKFQPKPYKDENGIFKIGYGTDLYPNGYSVTISDPSIDEVLGLAILKAQVDLIPLMYIYYFVKVPVNQKQIDALASLIFDIKGGEFIMSELIKIINLGLRLKDEIGITKLFLMCGGEIKRRQKESVYFLSSSK